MDGLCDFIFNLHLTISILVFCNKPDYYVDYVHVQKCSSKGCNYSN